MDVRTLCEDMLSLDFDRLCAYLRLSASSLFLANGRRAVMAVAQLPYSWFLPKVANLLLALWRCLLVAPELNRLQATF